MISIILKKISQGKNVKHVGDLAAQGHQAGQRVHHGGRCGQAWRSRSWQIFLKQDDSSALPGVWTSWWLNANINSFRLAHPITCLLRGFMSMGRRWSVALLTIQPNVLDTTSSRTSGVLVVFFTKWPPFSPRSMVKITHNINATSHIVFSVMFLLKSPQSYIHI